MADLSQIELNNVTYNLKDSVAREALETQTNSGEGLFTDYMGVGETEISSGRSFVVGKNKVTYIKSASSTAYRSCNLFGTPNILIGTFSDIDLSSQTFYDISLTNNTDLFITIEWDKLYTTVYNRFYVATKNPTTNVITKLRFALDSSTSIVNQYNLFELVPAIKENGNFALFYENINSNKTNSAKYWLSASSPVIQSDTIAFIKAIYPQGAICTCSNGSDTFVADSSDGLYVFHISETGNWTVTYTIDDETESQIINVTEYSAYTVDFNNYVVEHFKNEVNESSVPALVSNRVGDYIVWQPYGIERTTNELLLFVVINSSPNDYVRVLGTVSPINTTPTTQPLSGFNGGSLANSYAIITQNGYKLYVCQGAQGSIPYTQCIFYNGDKTKNISTDSDSVLAYIQTSTQTVVSYDQSQEALEALAQLNEVLNHFAIISGAQKA